MLPRTTKRAKPFDADLWDCFPGCDRWDIEGKKIPVWIDLPLVGPRGAKLKHVKRFKLNLYPKSDPVHRLVRFNGVVCDLFADPKGVYLSGWHYEKDVDIYWELDRPFATQADAIKYLEKMPSRMNTLDLTRRRFRTGNDI